MKERLSATKERGAAELKCRRDMIERSEEEHLGQDCGSGRGYST